MNQELLQQALNALLISAPLGHAMEDYEYRHRLIKDIEAELAKPEQAPIQLRRGDRLRPIDSDDVVCTVWATSTTGKTLVKWGANEFCEYTAEQIGELFWLVPRHEQELAKTEPEPVKCTCGYSIGHPLVSSCSCKPRKPWVGLTDDEVYEIANFCKDQSFSFYAKEIENKLRGNNAV